MSPLPVPLRVLLVLAVCLLASNIYGQRKQQVPPFLRHQPAKQTIELDGRTWTTPDFSVRMPQVGGLSLITRLPFGFLTVRDTPNGFALDVRPQQDAFRPTSFFARSPNPLAVTDGIGRTPNGPIFDFAQAAPHLAFFCRLEINEAVGNIIPVKFRLGGHRYWQDNLLRQ